MTPADVAAIQDELRAEKCSLVRVPQLCDALEAAWAERDEWADRAGRAESKVHIQAGLRERAERAEAERDAALDAWHGMGDAWAVERARAERAETLAAELMQDVSTEQAMTDRAEAALARVRAQLCDPGLDPIWDCTCCRDIRAAIEGDNQ